MPTQLELREEWLQALQNNTYPQGRGYLCRDGKYCVAGVACEIAYNHGLVMRETVNSGSEIRYGGDVFAISPAVATAYGMRSCFPEIVVGGELSCLYEANDDCGIPFPELAALIRANYERIFNPPYPPRGEDTSGVCAVSDCAGVAG